MSLIADESYTHPSEESVQSNTCLERCPSDQADPPVAAVPHTLLQHAKKTRRDRFGKVGLTDGSQFR